MPIILFLFDYVNLISQSASIDLSVVGIRFFLNIQLQYFNLNISNKILSIVVELLLLMYWDISS